MIVSCIKKHKFSIAVILIVVFFVFTVDQVFALSAPIITQAQETRLSGNRMLETKGIVTKGSDVLIYANGRLLGQASIQEENDLINNFTFKTKENLPFPPYSIQAVSREQVSLMVSFPSDKTMVKMVEAKVDDLKVKKENTKSSVITQTTIVKNPSKADPYTQEDKNRTTKESGTISSVGATEEQVIVKGIAGEAEKKESDSKSQTDLESILNGKLAVNDQSGTGLITERKESLGKIKLNLLIFIIFLMAVISWIIWVNRELVKEKEENIKEDMKDEKNIDILNF